MAAIDKLYCHSYYDFNDFRIWCIVYYPKLLIYFYNIVLTYSDYRKNVDDWLSLERSVIERDYYLKLGQFNNFEEAVSNLILHYKESVNYDCPLSQAESEVRYILDQKSKLSSDTLEDDYSFAVACFPYSIDKLLLWRCPIPFVRDYLESHCGYKTKWYHKLFFKKL